MRSLLGQHVDSQEYAKFYEKWGDNEKNATLQQQELEFIPLADNGPPSFTIREFSAPKVSPGDPGSKIPGIDKFRPPTGELAALFSHVHFTTDSYSINGEKQVLALRKVADYLVAHPDLYIFIEGHADERGAAAYNLALGAKRSNAIRSFLIQNGVNPDQLFTISYGLERPLAMGHDEQAWSKNRRGQFKLYGA